MVVGKAFGARMRGRASHWYPEQQPASLVLVRLLTLMIQSGAARGERWSLMAQLPLSPLLEPAMFELDPRLQADTWVLGDFPLCRLLLSKDANYPWLILVPRRAATTEIFELTEAEQAQLAVETAKLAEGMKPALKADKINVAALGNVVAQLHVHVIARYVADPAWPGPVWGKVPAVEYRPEQLDALKDTLRALLPVTFTWV